MAIPIVHILEAAGRAWGPTEPVPTDEMRNNFEWAWGLERGAFDEHVASYTDSSLAEVLLDDNLILIPHSELIRGIFFVAASLPWGFSSKKRVLIQDVYKELQTYEYLVLPIDSSSGVTPRTIVSSVPPHLTISYTVDKTTKRGGYLWSAFADIGKFLVKLFGPSPAPGATFTLKNDIFTKLDFIHKRWAIVSVPRRFLGLAGSEFEASDEEESSDNDTGSSTMECDAPTLPDEPQRRLFSHELKQDPVLKFWTPAAYDEDDAISQDSYITGVEDPEQFAKASLARGIYSPDRAWLKGVESWVENASDAGVVGDQVLVNDAQIDDDEQPRAVTSLDLESPDFHRIFRFATRV